MQADEFVEESLVAAAAAADEVDEALARADPLETIRARERVFETSADLNPDSGIEGRPDGRRGPLSGRLRRSPDWGEWRATCRRLSCESWLAHRW